MATETSITPSYSEPVPEDEVAKTTTRQIDTDEREVEQKQQTAYDFPLQWKLRLGCVDTSEGYALKEFGSFDDIGHMWEWVNNTVCKSEYLGAEFYLFRDFPSDDPEKVSGPSVENLKGLPFNDQQKITNITSMILEITPKKDEKFTAEQIIDINLNALLWQIGNQSDESDKILGIRFKQTPVDDSWIPQVRVWLMTNEKTEKGQKVIDTVHGEIGKMYSEQLAFDAEITMKTRQQLPKPQRNRRRKNNRNNY